MMMMMMSQVAWSNQQGTHHGSCYDHGNAQTSGQQTLLPKCPRKSQACQKGNLFSEYHAVYSIQLASCRFIQTFCWKMVEDFFFSGRRYKSPRRATLFSQYRGMLVVTKGPAPLLHHCVHLRAVSQHFSVLWRRHLGIWGLGNNQGRDYRE